MSKNSFTTVFAILAAICFTTNSGHAQIVDLNLNQEDVRILGESARDSSGYSLAYGDIDNDGFDDLVIGAPKADVTTPGQRRINAGNVYIIYGDATFRPPRQGLNLPGTSPGMLDGHRLTIIKGARGEARDSFGRVTYSGDLLGWSVATGDVDGDNLADVIIGSPFTNITEFADQGATYVVYSRANGISLKDITSIDLADYDMLLPPSVPINLRNRVTEIVGHQVSIGFGWSVASGDINHNGFDDVLTGAPFANPPGRTEAGATYVVYGSGTLPKLDRSTTGRTGQYRVLSPPPGTSLIEIQGEQDRDHLGWSVASGDINKDVSDDAIIGAPNANSRFPHAGKTYIISGISGMDLTTPFNLASPPAPIVKIIGANANDNSGWSVANGKINSASGKSDLIVGAPFSDTNGSDAGDAYVLFDSRLDPGSVVPGIVVDLSVDPANVTIHGIDSGDHAGWSVASGGFCNENIDDILVGAPLAGALATGEAYVVFARTLAIRPPAFSAATADIRVLGDDEGDLAGFAVAAGNLNGTGGKDFTLSGPEADGLTPNSQNVGETYVIYGSELMITAGPDQFICHPNNGGSVVLGGAILSGTPSTISWSPTDGLSDPTSLTPTATPTMTTNYTLTVTDARGCEASDECLVKVNPELIVSAEPDAEICLGGSVVLHGSITGGTPPYNFSWSPTAGLSDPTILMPTATPTVTTTYTLRAIDAEGCEDSDIVKVTVIVDNVPPTCVFDFRGISTAYGRFVDLGSGIASITPLLLYNCALTLDPPPPYPPGTHSVNFRLDGLGLDSYFGFDIKITDRCGNTHICDPVMSYLSADRNDRKYTIKFRSVDRYLILTNHGLSKIRVDLNGHQFNLYAESSGVVRTRNAYHMPKEGNLTIDLQPYLREGENLMHLEIEGEAGTNAELTLIDEAHNIDHTLELQPIPEVFQLSQNYPNPFNPSTTVHFSIPARLDEGAPVQLRIYNALGALVRTLVDEKMLPGLYAAQWNGKNDHGEPVASGIYIYQIIVGEFKATKRMTMVK
jgi:hypothetical protein